MRWEGVAPTTWQRTPRRPERRLRAVDQLVWSAARRLGILVQYAVTVVLALLVRDAIAHRSVLLADVFAGAAACLAIVAPLAMMRVRRRFAGVEEKASRRRSPYRDNAHSPGHEQCEPDRVRATQVAAHAFMALAIAAAFVVVAAASR